MQPTSGRLARGKREEEEEDSGQTYPFTRKENWYTRQSCITRATAAAAIYINPR